MAIRGVRGAITVENDSPDEVLQATRELMNAILEANPTLESEDLASVFFTLTPDLHSTYPARAARLLGWNGVPLLGAQEVDVPGGMLRVIRILVHWNTELPQKDIRHIYLKGAIGLRPDLVEEHNGGSHE